MALLAPDPTSTDEQLELLIREARRRQRRRRLAVLLFMLVAAGGCCLVTLSAGSSPRSTLLLARRLHLASLGPGGRCPVSSGYTVNTPYFGGNALGNGPVRVLLAQAGDIRHGRVDLVRSMSNAPHWFALQTLWFAMPGYAGPFIVRGARVGAHSPIEVQPGATASTPGSGPLVIPAGPTINSYPAPTAGPYRGYRTVPGSTWVKSPGCYAWQVDGRGFSEVIVIDATATGH